VRLFLLTDLMINRTHHLSTSAGRMDIASQSIPFFSHIKQVKKSPDSRGCESGQNASSSKASAQGGKKRKDS
jgi:hypothetical protein